MRHWIGMVLAIVMAGLVFFVGAWGYRRLLRLPVAGGQLAQMPGGGGSLLSDHSLLLGLAAIAGTGLVAGILIAAPRVSPLAAGLPGLVLLGWTGLYLVSVHRAVGLIPLKSTEPARAAGWRNPRSRGGWSGGGRAPGSRHRPISPPRSTIWPTPWCRAPAPAPAGRGVTRTRHNAFGSVVRQAAQPLSIAA